MRELHQRGSAYGTAWQPAASCARPTRLTHVVRPPAQATVTCTEVMAVGDNTGRILATNVFERQGGQWKVRGVPCTRPVLHRV